MNKYEIIKKYIDAYDYFGLLTCGAPKDEFDTYSRALAETISENDTAEHIAALIANTLDKAFAEEIDPQKFTETANKIKIALKENMP